MSGLPRMSSAKIAPISVGTTAVAWPFASQNLRESFSVYNMSSGKLFWGPDNTVTAATGFPCIPGFAADYGGTVFLVSDTAAQDVRCLLLW